MFSIYLSFAKGQVIDTLYPHECIRTYYVQENAGSTYHWEIIGGYIIVYQNNGSTVTVEWDTLKKYHELSVCEIDEYGCPSDTNKGAILLIKPNNLKVVGDTAICNGDIARINAGGADKYFWSTGETGPEISIKPTRDTIIHVFGYNLKDTSCKSHSVKVHPTPNAEFEYMPETIFIFDSVLFWHKSDDPLTYQWTLNFHEFITDSISFLNIFNESKYEYITLKVENEFGCFDTHTKKIYVFGQSSVYLPSIFTPNGDGLNDSFCIVGQGIEEIKILIFNRWGQIVFESTEVRFAWDGKHQDKECPIDTYYYQVYGRGENKKPFSKKGQVTLAR